MQAALPCNCFDPVQLLRRWPAQQRPQRMNAEPPALDGVPKRQDPHLCLGGKVQEAEDLGYVSPRNAQLPSQSRSECGCAAAYLLVPLPG